MIFAANFKTNKTRSSTKEYIETLEKNIKERNTTNQVYVFPPMTSLDNYETSLTIGAQNAYPTENGSFTGEIGLEQLGEFDIKTILIGHNERRSLLGENQEKIEEKFSFFKKHGFKIIYCIGEPLEIRLQGFEAVMKFLKKQFEGIDTRYSELIVAYEPVWAIGSKTPASIEEITETLRALRDFIRKPLLYGGSVNNSNIEEICSIFELDGVLVGAGSLDADKFSQMIINNQDRKEPHNQ